MRTPKAATAARKAATAARKAAIAARKAAIAAEKVILAAAALLLLLVFPMSGFAAPASTPSSASSGSEVLKKLQEKYEEVSTIKASFTQETFYKTLGQSQLSGGTLFIKKPGKMRWRYEGDDTDELISDGTTFWIFQKDLFQVIETQARGGPPAVALKFLTGMADIEDDFEVELSKEDKKSWTLLLRPRANMPNVKTIRVEVDKAKLLVLKTVVNDPFGTRTTVSLSNVTLNEEIEDSFFVFKTPKGVKVIKQ